MHFKPVKAMMDSKNGYVHRFGHYIAYLLEYRMMLSSMIRKDLKGRFKYTSLGYLWHLINPLSQIIIYLLIFTVIFGRDIPNYWVYVSTGMFAYTFFASCVTSGSNAVVGNAKMVTKMSFAREILVVSKVVSNLITLCISYTILALLMIVTGVGIGWGILFVPLLMASLAIMAMGFTFMLSAATVYLRDVANAVGIVMGCTMFAIPIFYIAEQRSTPLMEIIWSVNPLYHFVECIHDSFYLGVVPNLNSLLICLMVAPIVFVVGLYCFKKLEHGFAERL